MSEIKKETLKKAAETTADVFAIDADTSPTDSPPTEQTAPPASLEEALVAIADLQESLRQTSEELVSTRDLQLRDRAEIENFKKRVLREKADALRFATEGLLRDLLGSLDNLERATTAATVDGASVETLREGIDMVLEGLRGTLGRHGVTRIDTVERPFDPGEHEALAQIPTTQAMPGHIMDEHLAGYRLHDRLLRAAQVTVAQAPPAETETPTK